MTGFADRGGWWVVAQAVLLGGALLALVVVNSGFGVDGAIVPIVIGVGVAVLGIGIVLIVSGTSALGRNLTPYPAPLEDGEMVEHGAYRWVRHPLYLAFLMLIWSYPTLTPDRLLLNVLWTAWVVVGTMWEERDLVAEFGDTYRYYQRRVPMLIPWRIPRS